MNKTGYSSTPAPGSPAHSEAWALVEAAKRMAEAILNGDKDAARAALRLNWRLWTIFQAELSENEVSTPPQIRENMLRLCQFVDKITVSLLADPTPEGVNNLVNINRNIAQGLLASAERAVEAEQPAGATLTPAEAAQLRGQMLSTGA